MKDVDSPAGGGYELPRLRVISAEPPCGRPPARPQPPVEVLTVRRDDGYRELYLDWALAQLPRLLGAIDRCPYRPTYGCLDRDYWHYRTSDFPSEMYQQGVLPLALVYATELPGNCYFRETRVRELALAGIRFAARSCHADGSCDDYYPYERALGAAVFSLRATTRAYQLLDANDEEILRWFERRADWLTSHDESGRLANHQAVAALGLLRVAQITGERNWREAAERRIQRVLAWQSAEGWFDEYGGADPGYQTLTLDALIEYRRVTAAAWLDAPIRRGLAFARYFLHPDSSYGGEYGSRGTYHFFPHGMELLAHANRDAADLADGFLRSLRTGRQAHFDDDRLLAYRLGNLIEAYCDWSPVRAAPLDSRTRPRTRFFDAAGLLVHRANEHHTVISTARGGVFKHVTRHGRVATDAGLIAELEDGRVAASQWHGHTRSVDFTKAGSDAAIPKLRVCGPLNWIRFETATPLKLSLFRLGMWGVGRFCRGLVRRLLQRRLITQRRSCPIRLERWFRFIDGTEAVNGAHVEVTDTIELTDRRLNVARMSFGSDHQTAYVASCGVYQHGVLQPWDDLEPYVAALNEERRVTIVRTF